MHGKKLRTWTCSYEPQKCMWYRGFGGGLSMGNCSWIKHDTATNFMKEIKGKKMGSRNLWHKNQCRKGLTSLCIVFGFTTVGMDTVMTTRGGVANALCNTLTLFGLLTTTSNLHQLNEVFGISVRKRIVLDELANKETRKEYTYQGIWFLANKVLSFYDRAKNSQGLKCLFQTREKMYRPKYPLEEQGARPEIIKFRSSYKAYLPLSSYTWYTGFTVH